MAPAVRPAPRVDVLPDDNDLPADLGPIGPPPVYGGPFQFITGPAGTGKTTLVRNWRTHGGGLLLCATTGIAAVNLGDCVTMHSTLRFFDTASVEEMFINGFLQARMRKLRASGVTRYGIDEVSMMSAGVLTILTQAVEELNSDAAVHAGHEPEIGITLIGDFLQLPPVKEPYAFESQEWAKYDANTLRLTEMRRQTDPDFIHALQAVRVGDAATALRYLRPHMATMQDTRYPGVTVLAKNDQVFRFNKLRHDALPGTPTVFPSKTTGEPLREWQREIPVSIALKPGARVMILANRYMPGLGGETPELVYANGDTGEFVDGDPARKVARVQLYRTRTIVTVMYNVRQNLLPTGAKGKKKDRYQVLGEIDYMPLRLAYCTSVHKSQGLTLDQVQVDISDRFFSEPAMTYVALSRARSLEGLRLVGNPRLLEARCTVDPKVERWR